MVGFFSGFIPGPRRPEESSCDLRCFSARCRTVALATPIFVWSFWDLDFSNDGRKLRVFTWKITLNWEKMTQNTLRRKVTVGGGILTAIGLMAYEIFRIRRQFNSLVDISVMDYDRKRPDYIYINYSIYRESLRRMQEEQESKTFVNIISHPVEKWWKAMKHSVAWRLLKMAQSSDRHDRVKAVRQLALVDHLKSWDYQHLAQICDARTAVSLARSNCDLRWFLPPRFLGVVKNPKVLLKDIHRLLEDVQSNKCAKTLLQKTFGKYEFQQVEPDQETLHYVKGFRMNTELELLKQCIDVFAHLSEYRDVAERIISEGGLAHLMEIHKIFRDDFDMTLKICRVIANLSVCWSHCEDFFVTGWISVLAQWTRSDDMRMCVTSAKTLRNLDTDDSGFCLYKSKIYPLYPLWRRKRRPEVDVVFVHGILGGVFVTWRQKEGVASEGMRQGGVIRMSRVPGRQSFSAELLESLEGIDKNRGDLSEDWEIVYEDCPEAASTDALGPFSVSGEEWNAPQENAYSNCWAMDWLKESFPDIRVIGLNYDSTLSEWYSKCHGCGCYITRGTVETRAREFLEQLVEAGVGDGGRPVVWVGHSMGGLIVKSIITQALKSPDNKIRDIGANTRGIMFLGTPHRGTSVAKLKQHTQMLLSPTLEVREMEENAKSLLDLHSDFVGRIRDIYPGVEIVSIAEGLPTILTSFKLSYHVVTEESARIELGDFYRLNDDHLGICKPSSRHSFLYQRLLGLIRRIHEDLQQTEVTPSGRSPA